MSPQGPSPGIRAGAAGYRYGLAQAVDAAMRSEGFYNLALLPDSHIYSYGAVPLSPPANAKLAFAILIGRSQSNSPQAPDEIIVAMVQGTRIAIAVVKVSTPIKPLPACEAIVQEYKRKQEQLRTAQAINPDDKTFRAESDRLSAEEDNATPKCFA